MLQSLASQKMTGLTEGNVQIIFLQSNLFAHGLRSDSPSPNVSPGNCTPVVFNMRGKPVLQSMTWGLVPSFNSDTKLDHFKMFNARFAPVLLF